MAAQVLPNTHAHLFPRRESLPTDMQGYLTGFESLDSFPLSSNSLAFVSQTSPYLQSQTTDNTYRPLSQSPRPSIYGSYGHERTPIRHHSSGISRNRSPSRSELMLAYATEQQEQAQQPSLLSTASLVPSQSHSSSSTSIQDMGSYPGSLGIGGYIDPNSFLMGNPTAQSGSLTAEMSYSTGVEMPRFYATQIPIGHSPMMPTSTFAVHEPQYTTDMLIQGSPVHNGSPDPGIGTSFPPISMPLESTQDESDLATSRPKPQCWDHGCNGRQFSTFSNLLRHQREKSGNATKAVCPHCGTEFTRTTARNGHLYGGKCKVLQEKEASQETEAAE